MNWWIQTASSIVPIQTPSSGNIDWVACPYMIIEHPGFNKLELEWDWNEGIIQFIYRIHPLSICFREDLPTNNSKQKTHRLFPLGSWIEGRKTVTTLSRTSYSYWMQSIFTRRMLIEQLVIHMKIASKIGWINQKYILTTCIHLYQFSLLTLHS